MVLSEKDIFNRLRDIFAPTTITDPLMERIAEQVRQLISEEIARNESTTLCGWKADDLRILNDRMVVAKIFKPQLLVILDTWATMQLGQQSKVGETLMVSHSPKPIQTLTPGQEVLSDISEDASILEETEYIIADYTPEDESLGGAIKTFANKSDAKKYAQALINVYDALGVPYEIHLVKTDLLIKYMDEA